MDGAAMPLESVPAPQVCPICETFPESILFTEPPSTEAPVLRYILEENRPWTEIREDWMSQCGLYKLVVYLERGLFDYEDSIFIGSDRRTCLRSIKGTEIDRSFSLACAYDSPIAPYVEQRYVHRSPISSSAIGVINYWIDECTRKHPDCKRSQKTLPTRILDIQNAHVRLVESTDQLEQYVALSHCWGCSQGFTTTKATLAARKAGFGIEELPPTFGDAVILSRGLGFRYIWIDSLCIVQDDISDWKKEVAKMSEVYTGAHLTLCVSSASSDSDGFIQERHSPYMPLALTRPNGEELVVHLLPEKTFPKMPVWPTSDKEPLNSRGWTFQERYLSRRKLIISKDELGWECQTFRMEESSCITTDKVDSYKINKLGPCWEQMSYRTANGVYFQWREAVSLYSERALTKETDRLPALAGLAKALAKRTKSRYCAGIWADDMPFGLLWTASDHCSRPSSWLAPSWSWASLIGPVYWTRSGTDSFAKLSSMCSNLECLPEHGLNTGIPLCALSLDSAQLQHIHVHASEGNLYGIIKDAWLNIGASVLPVIAYGLFGKITPQEAISKSSTFGPSFFLVGGGNYRLKYHFDVASEASVDISLLPLMYTDECVGVFRDIRLRVIYGLLVQEVKYKVSSYRRVGHFNLKIPPQIIERVLRSYTPRNIILT